MRQSDSAQEEDDVLTATAKSRTNLALHHLFAACRFTARIGEIEDQNSHQPFGTFWEEILQNALGVATLSVACIECYANELYFEGSAISSALNPAAVEVVAEMIDSEPILRKYSVALAVRVGKKLDFGIPSVQNADAIIKLRNAVVHFRPEWFEEQDKHDKLSKVLQYKFKTSPFLQGEPVFPRAWASHDFATWAVRSSVTFLEYFYAQAGIDCPLDKFKTRLSELLAMRSNPLMQPTGMKPPAAD